MTLRPIARLIPLILLGSSAFALAQSAGPTTYKWVDENGRVTYSDTPPLGKVKAQEQLRLQVPANPGAAQQVFNQDAQLRKRQDDDAKKQADATKKEEAEARRRDECSRSRGELRALRDTTPIIKLNENGERVMVDDAMRESERRRVETFLEENCAQPG
jgi:hypothetical protein